MERIRQSISCMLAGLLIGSSFTCFAIAYLHDWQWHKLFSVAVIAIGVIGAMWLWDEMRSLLARQG
jgi:hypothetical protein